MNVTQTIQSTVQVKSKEKQPEIDGEKFSKAFEQHTAADLKKESQLTEGSESEEEAEPASFTLLNPFLNLESEIKDINTLGKSFNLHTEPYTGEATLIPVNQLNISQTETTADKQDLIEISSELTENLTKEQLNVLTSLADSRQLIEGKTLTEVVKEINTLMESASSPNTLESDALIKADSLIDLDTSGKELEEQASKGSLNEISYTHKPESTVENTEQTKNDLIKVDSDNKVSIQQSDKGSDPENNANGKTNVNKPTSETAPIAAEASKQKPALETNQLAEVNTLESESADKAVTQMTKTETASQTDTEYDFVSMLRQLSNQSTKVQSQAPVEPADKATIPVPKEEGMNLIQDMVTSLVENKEGQKTYQTTLHLTPETLGKVTVELSLNEEGLSGKLTFQSDEARRWMEGEWLDLKLPMESKGLTIKSFDFTTSQPASQQQSSFSFSEQSGGSGQDPQRRSSSGVDSSILSENDEQNVETNKNQTKGLNVYV